MHSQSSIIDGVIDTYGDAINTYGDAIGAYGQALSNIIGYFFGNDNNMSEYTQNCYYKPNSDITSLSKVENYFEEIR